MTTLQDLEGVFAVDLPTKEQSVAEQREVQQQLAKLSDAHLFDLVAAGYLYRTPPLRSSGYKTWRECPRKALWQDHFGFQLKGEYAAALELGDMFHLCAINLVNGASWNNARKAAINKRERLQEELTELAQDNGGRLPGGQELRSVLQRLEDDCNKALMMARVFYENYPSWMKEMQTVDVLSEKLIEYTIPGMRVPLLGRIDLVLAAQRGENGHPAEEAQFWICDLKTCSAEIDTIDRAAQVRFDRQPYIYRHLLRKGLRDLGVKNPKIVGVIHVIVQKPNLKFCYKDKGSFENYVKRCKTDFYQQKMEDYQNGDTHCPPILVSRIEFNGPRDPSWFTNSLKDYEKSLLAKPDSAVFYPDEGACFKWKRRCKYWDLCTSNPNVWPQVVLDKYKQEYREDTEDAA